MICEFIVILMNVLQFSQLCLFFTTFVNWNKNFILRKYIFTEIKLNNVCHNKCPRDNDKSFVCIREICILIKADRILGVDIMLS